MKHRLIILSFILLIFCSWSRIYAQDNGNEEQHPCLKCHSSQTYSFYNDLMEREERKLMNPFYIIDTVALRMGVHNAFECIDCHSYEYMEYPHKAQIKLEPLPTCLDCHGGGDTPFQFDEIQEEFQKSIHYQEHQDNFTCSKCHDIHTYRPVSTTSDNIKEIVNYSNGMCLSCHDNMREYNLVSGRTNPEIVEVHEWLPNQQLHFRSVRCIECHTDVQEGLMVPHNIVGKEQAVRKCAECHSRNSRLKATLYKYQNLQQRAEEGGLGAVISNQAYVIGTHQVPFLRTLGFIITALTLAVIGIHIVFRIINKK
ncbi:MAG: cytochrome c3 family protein [Bacteroidota bacterium]